MTNLQFSFNVSAAQSFLNDFSSKNDSYYMMISRPQAWVNDDIPPAVVDSVSEQVDLWKNCIAAKKINSENVRLVIDRHDWESGAVYSQFSDIQEIFRSVTYDNQPFYVMNSQYKVYKCLDNNGGSQSTVEPTHTYADIQTPGADGYVWQFMYQLSESDFDFVTDGFIPVSLAGSTTKIGTIEYLQREVQENARGGAIFNVRVNQTGSYWQDARILKGGKTVEDFFVKHKITNIENDQEYYVNSEGVTYDVARFSAAGMNSFSKDYYRGWAITDYDMGTSTGVPSFDYSVIGYYKKIIGNSGDFVYTSRFESDPETTVGYYNIVPYVFITNGTGSTQETNVIVAPVFDDVVGSTDTSLIRDNELTVLESKKITRVRTLDPGSDVYQPFVLVSPTPSGLNSGAGFNADAFASPLGGHGSNAVEELGANKVMIRVLLKGSESGAFDVQNDFRQFSIIKNPHNSGWTSDVVEGSVAGSKTPDYTILNVRNDLNTVLIDMASTLQHSQSAFTIGQKVHQGEYSLNQARGTVLKWIGGVAGQLTLSVDNGKFRSCTPEEISTTSGRIFYGETTGTAYTGGSAGPFGGFIDSVVTNKSFVNQSYPEGSLVYGLDSGSTGKVVSWRSESDGERGTLTLRNVVGDFIPPRVALGTQLDGEPVFGFSVSSNGNYSISNTPVSVITKITKEPVTVDESHRLTKKITSFFSDPTFQLTPSLLDQPLKKENGVFNSTIVSMNYTDGVTSGVDGSTVDFYVTSVSGSLTGGDVLNLSGFTSSYISGLEPEFLPYTGQVLYIENVRPVQRNSDQDEEIKLVIDF